MPSDFIHHWSLNSEITFLNHGSFGACPHSVLDYQTRLRERMERQPVQFFHRDLYELQDDARTAIAAFMQTQTDSLAFVRNASEGMNGILRSLSFKPGDQILVTNHIYPACLNALRYICHKFKAELVTVDIPFMGVTPAEIISRVWAGVTRHTKLLVIDHVTSPTGLVFPIEELILPFRNKGIMTLVDGAHGPGMVDLNLDVLEPNWYVGNFHKWVCAPKGAAFVYAHPDNEFAIHPATISHGYALSSEATGRSSFHLEFDWTGTQDVTPWLSVPYAIDFCASLVDGGFNEIRSRNREMALIGRNLIAEALEIDPPTSDELIGHMAALPLPLSLCQDNPSPLFGTQLQQTLLDEHAIEVPIICWPYQTERLVRISAALYNDLDDYQRLAHALKEI